MFKAEWTNKDSLDLQQTCNKLATNLQPTEGDIISREGAIEAACNEMDWLDDGCVEERKTMIKDALSALPSADAVTHGLRTGTHGVCLESIGYMLGYGQGKADAFAQADTMSSTSLPSAEAEPKWNCTANFVAEQLDRLRKMTDEEKWNFFREFFGMGDAVQGEWKPFDITWGRSTYYCSVCEESTDVPTEMGKPIYNYCPNCGARMKGGDDE